MSPRPVGDRCAEPEANDGKEESTVRNNRSAAWTALKLMLLFVIAAGAAQDDCDIDQSFQNALTSRVRAIRAAKGQDLVYVSSISFIDGVTKTNFLSVEGELINQAVKDGMQLAADSDTSLQLDIEGHRVPDVPATVNKLILIYFDPDLTLKAKFDTISRQLLDPYAVDVLITGVIVDTGTIIKVRPFGVSRVDKLIRTKDLSFANRQELFERQGNTVILTRRAHEDIRTAVKEILLEN